MIKICDIYFKKGKALQLFKLKLIKSGYTQEEATKCLYACCPNELAYFYARNVVGIPVENIHLYNADCGLDYLEWLKVESANEKFDLIIQNPPCDKDYIQLRYFSVGMDMLSESGKMIFLTSASWLTNLRKQKFGRIIKEIKDRIEGHVVSVIIRNLNREFSKRSDYPYSITTIDMGATHNTIEFDCCGDKNTVTSIKDCNLIGDHKIVNSILSKCKSFDKLAEGHICDEKLDGCHDYLYCTKYLGSDCIGCGGVEAYNNKVVWAEHACGTYLKGYLHTLYRGDGYNNKNNFFSIYGTKRELENFKTYATKNKLPIFLSFVLTDGRHNHTLEYLPWLVEKEYTDDEIFKILNLSEDEINLIESTLKRYEKGSEWFKKYRKGNSNFE